MSNHWKIGGLLTTLWVIPALLWAQSDKDEWTVEAYIEQFKDIAIQEMERSGVPASIKLAQGIHESAFGNSELARKAKNHFGIKCTKDWEGKTMYKWDDEIQKSCFRFYSAAEDSYVDHTDFLLNRRHYAFLFEYKRDDYKRWARGLRKAGYATDPRYAEKIISTIEKYNLQQYDRATGVLTYDTTPLNVETPLTRGKRRKPRSFLFKRYKPGFFRTNGASYAISRKGESPLAVAKRFGIPYKRFLKFNDLEDGDHLIDYQPAYIQPKRAIYKGEEETYTVEKDITMYEIAQEFGVKLSSLLALNLLKEGEEPANGQKIQLKETALERPQLRPRRHVDTLPPQYVPEDKNDALKKPVNVVVVIPKVERPKPQPMELNQPLYNAGVYADTAQINTSLSKNREYLNAQIVSQRTSTRVNPDGSTTTTTVIRRRPTTPNNNASTNPTVSANQANASNLPNTNTTPPNNDPRINNNALFPTNNNNNTNNNTPPNNNTVIRRPQIPPNPTPKPPTPSPLTPNQPDTRSGFTNEGSTRDYPQNTVQPSNPNVEIGETINNEAAPDFVEHIVQKGETLYAIHRKYNVPVPTIQELNGLSDTNIKIGQALRIPVK